MNATEVQRTPIHPISDPNAGLYLWLIVGTSLGGVLILILIVAAFLYARRRRRKGFENHGHVGYVPGKEFCRQDLSSSLSSVGSDEPPVKPKARIFRKPLKSSQSLDLPSSFFYQERDLPRWNTVTGVPMDYTSVNRAGSDEEGSPPCLHGRIWFSLEHKKNNGGELYVTIHKAKYLSGRGLVNYPRNPFVKVYLLPDEEHSHQTRIRRKTLAPKYHETFTFKVKAEELRRRTLKLTVYDIDRRKIRYCLGHVLQPLDLIETLGSGEFYRDLEMTPKPHAAPGEIQVAFSCSPNSNRVKVTVHRIRRLLAQVDPASGVFVRVELFHGHRRIKCKRTRSVLEAVEGGEFVFEESFGFAVSCRLLDVCSFELVVVCGSSPVGHLAIGPFMYARGEALQHWQDMLARPRTAVTRWHSLSAEFSCQDTDDVEGEKP